MCDADLVNTGLDLEDMDPIELLEATEAILRKQAGPPDRLIESRKRSGMPLPWEEAARQIRMLTATMDLMAENIGIAVRLLQKRPP